MRRLFLRLEVIVVLVVAVCLAALAAASEPAARPELELTAGPGDTLTLSNSKEAAAILSLGGMRPGDSVTDTVTLGNTGTIPAISPSRRPTSSTYRARRRRPLRQARPAGQGHTSAGSPVTVYNGKIERLRPSIWAPSRQGHPASTSSG